MKETVTSVGIALGNHLWQSTVFVVIAALLAVLLKKNQARTRYWIWLTASAKFLLPFSLLIGLGGLLPRPAHVPGAALTSHVTMDTLSQPFLEAGWTDISTSVVRGKTYWLPEALALLWFCGFIVVVAKMWIRWRRVAAVAREAVEITTGREAEMLRKLEQGTGMRPVRLLLSKGPMEPGVFGAVRPVLLWPQGISVRLTDEQMESILAHELCHVRRRDNLFAMMQMLVEAVFWFYPLVWRVGARMVDERERACDEEVLGTGRNREVYAESVLKVCEFCLESPMACVSGVTGADLKRRVVEIMSNRASRKLNLARKLLLAATAIAVIAGPMLLGQLSTNKKVDAPRLEVISIKKSDPNSTRTQNALTATGMSLVRMPVANIVTQAFMKDFFGQGRMVGVPDWTKQERYDITGKVADADLPKLQNLNFQETGDIRGAMMLQVLQERFGLKTHIEEREMPVYALTVASSGMKLKEAKPGDTYADGVRAPGGSSPMGAGGVGFAAGQEKGTLVLTGQSVMIDTLIDRLMTPAGRVVVDRTGLKSRYDFKLTYAAPPPGQAQAADGAAETTGPSIFTAVQEQLGLKLEPTTAKVKVVVVDSMELPTEN